MPLYVYTCPEHGAISKMRKIIDRELSVKCPECDKDCPYTPDFKTGAPVFKGKGFHSTDYGVKEGTR